MKKINQYNNLPLTLISGKTLHTPNNYLPSKGYGLPILPLESFNVLRNSTKQNLMDNYFNIANNGFHTIDFNFYQDVNFDNIFNILDIISIVNHIINNEILLGISFSNADLDQNGILDILDIIMLVYLITKE